ncbi:hypothetical protein Rsub_04159 [Raphidocelis subcapitata]|uniref:Uncharacterized protein n=1 Tax=Raphidocelis subcapitata TaxID=307507 RepID=A0A2V0NVR2_9CHLO|nr:hypothetical protein Rsub_04159 [Raphidocelis subcapitata]|eukprot:GBF91419.1 hypothetical protein Rsub_04159 [Raphidocelis subcapitata]
MQAMRCLGRPASGIARPQLRRTTACRAAAAARPQRAAAAVQQQQQQQQRQHAQQQQQQQQQQQLGGGAAALAALGLPLPALAEEAAAQAAPALEPTPAFYAVATVPLATYALFWIYRDRVNPKATIGDFLYILGAIVIVGNILSILIFKIRFF